MRSASVKPPKGPKSDLGLQLAVAAVTTFVAVALLLLTSGCSPKIIREIQHDTTYVERVRVDSLYKRDSVYIREKGDTLYVYQEHIRDRYIFRCDTVRLVKVDSVTVERVKEVKVPQPLTKAQTLKIRAFWGLLGAVVLLLLWTFRKSILKLLKI